MHSTDSGINLICLSQEQPPTIFGIIHINKQLKVCLYSDQQLLPCSSYKHIVAAGDFTLLFQVTNLLAFQKNFKTSDCSSSILIVKIVQLIEKFSDINDSNETHRRLCDFMLEQLNLITKSKHQRRYSVDLLLAFFIINATNSKAYKRILDKHILVLPCVNF